MKMYVVHIVFRRKDNPYQHQHFNEDVITHSASHARLKVSTSFTVRELHCVPDDFDYEAHDVTIGAAIEQTI